MARPTKKIKSAQRGQKQQTVAQEVKESVVETTAPVVNEEPVKEEIKELSVPEYEDAIIGAILKHHDGFKSIYSVLGFDYHFQGFLHQLIWVSASELNKMHINVETSTIVSRLQTGHKTSVDINQLEVWEKAAPTLEVAAKLAQLLKSTHGND